MTLKQLTIKPFAWLALLLTLALISAVGAVQVSAEAGGQSGLNPSFDPLTLNYTATVPHDVTEVTFDLRAQHPKATVTVNGGDPSTLVQLAVGENTIKIVVTAEDARYTRTYTIVVTRLEAKANEAPTVASGLADATIANQSGTQRVSLSGVFSDADGDDLTIKARSSNESVATVAVSNDTLTVTARSLGVANITVTASDGEDEVSDSFTVTVKSAPVVSSPIADINELEAEASREISLSGVFSDADGDALTLSAATSDREIVNISTALDGATLSATAVTVIGIAEGTGTITVTAQDPDGNSVSDTFDVTVPAAEAQQQQQADAVPGHVVNLSLRQTQPTRIRVEWEVPEDGGAVNSYQVALSRDGEELSTRRPGAKKRHVVIRKLEPGASYTVSVRAKNATGLGPETTAQITLTVSGDDDPAEAPTQPEEQASAQQQQQVPVNQPPTVAAPISDISGLKPGASRPVSLTGAFQDADGDTMTISAKSAAAAVATVSVATDGASLSVTAVATGTATVTVSADDGNGGTVSDSFTVTVEAANTAPTVASAIGDISGLRRGDARTVSLTGVFADADGDALTITAQSSAAAVVTASVAPGGASLMIAALSEGAATITVTADDGNGGTVADSFAVTVAGNQAPTVAAPIGDISGVKPGDSRVVSLSGVFADAEGDSLTLTARTSNRAVATVAANGASLTVTAQSEGAATITVTADDGQGDTVADSFTVTVAGNAAPRVVRSMADISGLTEQTTKRVLLNDTFRDADDDPLTITAASSDETVVRVSLDYNYYGLTVNAVSAGSATVTVTADDGNGGRASESFAVTVTAQPDNAPNQAPDSESTPAAEEAAAAEQEDVLVRYDTDGDGKISKAEYDAALPDLGATLTLNELIRLRAAWLASAR